MKKTYENNYLIPCEEFVLELNPSNFYDINCTKENWDIDWLKEVGNYSTKCFNYAKLLTQPLSIEMFVPCKNGEVLNEPKVSDYDNNIDLSFGLADYEEAKSKVLFKGFEMSECKITKNTSKNLILHKESGVFLDPEKFSPYKVIADLIPLGLKITDNFKKLVENGN